VAERLSDQLSFRVAASERAALEQIAQEHNRTVAYIARTAIQVFLIRDAAVRKSTQAAA